MARSPLSTRLCALIASLLFLLSAQAAAQSTTSTSAPPTTTGAVTASIYPGTSTWGYIGCYNETDAINGTGGLRALSGGPQEVLTNMTVGECLSFCNGYAYAGLEYSRECWCSQYLSALSAKLSDPSCDLSCEGNSSQVCGGYDKLTVYHVKSATKGAGTKGIREAPVAVLALGIAMGVLFCLA